MEPIDLTRDQVPLFLKNSQFYREQIEGDDQQEFIAVDSRYFKLTGTLNERLQMCDFWNVDKIPDDLIEYIFSKEYDSPLYQEIKQLPFLTPQEIGHTLRKLKYSGDYNFLGENRVMSIVYSGGRDQLKTIKLKEEYVQIFAKKGYVDCLKLAHEYGWSLNENICDFAAENGHLECLIYIHKNDCHWSEWTCQMAAKNGHLECLKYVHENGCPWDEYTCEYAAFNGHLECLKYAHENGCPWNILTCLEASKNGHLDCLTYAKEHGCALDNNNLNIHEYLLNCWKYTKEYEYSHI